MPLFPLYFRIGFEPCGGSHPAHAADALTAPTIAEAIDRAAAEGAARIIVAPTMLWRGNQHTEAEISAIVAEARDRHPDVVVHYAWPFDDEQVVRLFAEHVLANGETKCA